MEALTRLVSESLARHGFDRPVDYRRLKWSRWFRCESHHSLLFVPSKPGVFALAEEITHRETAHGATAASAVPRTRSQAQGSGFIPDESHSPDADAPRHMLAVTQFFEADDMAFVLDRMLSRYNPMRARLESGRYFIRFVVIEDESQRRSIHAALDQWIHSSAEKAAAIGGNFATSLELTPASERVSRPDDSQESLFSSAEMGRVIFSAHIATAHGATAAKPALSAVEGAVPRSEASGPVRAADMEQPTAPVAALRPAGTDTETQDPPAFPSGF